MPPTILIFFTCTTLGKSSKLFTRNVCQCNTSGVTGRGGGGAGGAEGPPETSDREIFADVSGKQRQGKKREKGWKLRRKGGKLEIEAGKRYKEVRTFFFFFSFAFHFWKWQKFVLGLPKSEFSTGKKHFTPGKKIRKNNFAPSEKCLLCPCAIRPRNLKQSCAISLRL